MKLVAIFLFFIVLMACSLTSEPIPPYTIDTAIANTLIAQAKATVSSEVVGSPTRVLTSEPLPTSIPNSTNTPRPTSTPRPTTPPSLGTINYPYPYMEEVNLIQNDKAEFSMQIVDLIRGEEAFRIILLANQFNDKPPQGMEYVLIKIRIRMTGGSGVVQLDNSDIATISNGQIFGGLDFSVCCLDSVNYQELEANLISIGAETEGWVARPVFIIDTKPMIAININTFIPDVEDGLFFALAP